MVPSAAPARLDVALLRALTASAVIGGSAARAPFGRLTGGENGGAEPTRLSGGCRMLSLALGAVGGAATALRRCGLRKSAPVVGVCRVVSGGGTGRGWAGVISGERTAGVRALSLSGG
jgi:hypothetical protein